MDDFLGGISREHPWDILLLQEFDGTTEGFDVDDQHSFVTTDEHVVFVAPPSSGSRATAIVVNEMVTHCITPSSFTFVDRGCRLLLHWEGHNVALCCMHLPSASSSLEDYSISLNVLEELTDPEVITTQFITKGIKDRLLRA